MSRSEQKVPEGGPQRVFLCRFMVRGYELDSFGHVNNAVYLNYAEFARWTMTREATGSVEYFKQRGCVPVVARVEVDYRSPCFSGDDLCVETRLIERRTRVAVFQHRILNETRGQCAADVKATIVTVNAEGKAIQLPGDFDSFFR